MSRQGEKKLVSIVGNGGVGKSTIQHILTLQGIQMKHSMTIGVEVGFCPITFFAGDFKNSVLIFDHAGQKNQRVTKFWGETDVFILVFDCRYFETYKCLETWIRQIREMNKTSLYYIVGTKVDMVDEFTKHEMEVYIRADYPGIDFLLINSHQPNQVWAMFGAILIHEKILNGCGYARNQDLRKRIKDLRRKKVSHGDDIVDLTC